MAHKSDITECYWNGSSTTDRYHGPKFVYHSAEFSSRPAPEWAIEGNSYFFPYVCVFGGILKWRTCSHVRSQLMDRYPRMTFRLNPCLLTKINYLSISRHRTRGQVIREAVEMYYRVYNPVVLVEPATEPNHHESPTESWKLRNRCCEKSHFLCAPLKSNYK